MSAAEKLLQRLERVRQTGAHQWLARCPAHPDQSPSLSIAERDGRVLVHCFAGCAVDDVLAAVGLSLGDLFDKPLDHHCPPLSRHEWQRQTQAREALSALSHEVRVVHDLADQMHAGFALDPADRERLELAKRRIGNAEVITQ